MTYSALAADAGGAGGGRPGAWGGCTSFTVSTLASPFGWEVGSLGLGGGELACGVVWPYAFSAVFLNGSRWGGSRGWGAVLV